MHHHVRVEQKDIYTIYLQSTIKSKSEKKDIRQMNRYYDFQQESTTHCSFLSIFQGNIYYWIFIGLSLKAEAWRHFPLVQKTLETKGFSLSLSYSFDIQMVVITIYYILTHVNVFSPETLVVVLEYIFGHYDTMSGNEFIKRKKTFAAAAGSDLLHHPPCARRMWRSSSPLGHPTR